MQIRVLGCSGSIAAGSRTTSFLLDDDVLIDAGTGVGDLTLEQMAGIDHILVTHAAPPPARRCACTRWRRRSRR